MQQRLNGWSWGSFLRVYTIEGLAYGLCGPDINGVGPDDVGQAWLRLEESPSRQDHQSPIAARRLCDSDGVSQRADLLAPIKNVAQTEA
jgi:hypothetical protein